MSTRRLTWTAYLLMACQGYLIYSVGYITPYLQSELGTPSWAAAMPSASLAAGMFVSAFIVNLVVRRIGAGPAIRLWIALMAVTAVLMSLAVSIWPILAGAFFFGIAAAGSLVYVITMLGSQANGVYLMRSAMWSVVGGVVGPVALSAAARSIGWNLGPLLPVPLLVVLVLAVPTPAMGRSAVTGHVREPGLGRWYWLTWVYLTLAIGAEFSFVAWGAQVAVARAGLALADATALAALFVVGEILGRLALSGGPGSRVDIQTVLRLSTVVTATGGALLWVAGTPIMVGIGMFVGGVGLAGLYPLTARLAVAQAPQAPVKAGARLTAASGVAISGAPLLLGLVAGLAGVITAWGLLLAMLAVALVILWRIPRPAAPAREAV
jgi:MFS family permease